MELQTTPLCFTAVPRGRDPARVHSCFFLYVVIKKLLSTSLSNMQMWKHNKHQQISGEWESRDVLVFRKRHLMQHFPHLKHISHYSNLIVLRPSHFATAKTLWPVERSLVSNKYRDLTQALLCLFLGYAVSPKVPATYTGSRNSTTDTLGYRLSLCPSFFLPHFNFISDQLLNRCTTTCNVHIKWIYDEK